MPKQPKESYMDPISLYGTQIKRPIRSIIPNISIYLFMHFPIFQMSAQTSTTMLLRPHSIVHLEGM